MKKLITIVLCISLLLITGCHKNDPPKSPQTESNNAEELNTSSTDESLSDISSISSIIERSLSIEYISNEDWVTLDTSSEEGKDFIIKLNKIFPENFGECACAYIPEDIIIKFNLDEAQYNINGSSGAMDIKKVTISTVEIDSNGIVFLMPQGTALAKIKNISTIVK